MTGCDVGSPSLTASSRGFDSPPVQLGVVEATVGYTSTGWPIYARLSEGDILEGVETSASFRFHFDRFLGSPTRQSICIRASTEEVNSLADCGNPGQEFKAVEYNPVLRQVTYRLPVSSNLQPDTLYRVTAFAAPEEAFPGFVAFDGAALARTYTFDFRTSATLSSVDEPLPSDTRYCAAVACFAACDAGDAACRQNCQPLCVEPSCFNDGQLYRDSEMFRNCAFGGCHAPGPGADGTPSNNSVIAANLDLRDGAAIAATAFNQVAHQTQIGEGAPLESLSPVSFGRFMPIINPSNPGNSYLLYKMIVKADHHVNAVGDTPIDPSLVAEIERLRNSFVVGVPMPAEAGVIPAALVTDVTDDGRTVADPAASQEALLRIYSWIANGAVVDCSAL